MIMTDKDICKEYREAKNKANQITILADLNQCSRKEILDVLEANGVKIDQRLRGRSSLPKSQSVRSTEAAKAGTEKPAAPMSPAPVKAEPVMLTPEESEALLGLLTDVLPEYIEGKVSNMDLLEVHMLTGIYQKCL